MESILHKGIRSLIVKNIKSVTVNLLICYILRDTIGEKSGSDFRIEIYGAKFNISKVISLQTCFSNPSMKGVHVDPVFAFKFSNGKVIVMLVFNIKSVLQNEIYPPKYSTGRPYF